MVNPEKALEDSKPMRVKDEPMSDIAFPVSEEPEADLASGDQALPIGVLGTSSERMAGGLDAENSPHVSGNTLLNMKHFKEAFDTENSLHFFVADVDFANLCELCQFMQCRLTILVVLTLKNWKFFENSISHILSMQFPHPHIILTCSQKE